jgi:hypothetical protein
MSGPVTEGVLWVDRLIVVTLLAVVPLAVACGASAPTAGPQRGVTISDLQQKDYFYQGKFLGQTVTVSSKVADVLGPGVFELSGGNVGAEKLTVVTGSAGPGLEGRRGTGHRDRGAAASLGPVRGGAL